MNPLLLGLGLWLLLSTSLATTLPPYSQRYDSERDPFADGHQALAIARDTQRKVIIEVGGDWCVWCHKLDQFIQANPPLYSALHQHFVVLKVNVSDANGNEKFLSAFPKPLGYPHIYVADAQGQLLHSQDTAEFLHQGEYSASNFIRFINQWK